MKRECSKCQRVVEYTNNGKNYWCSSCRKEYYSKWVKKHPENDRENHKKHQQGDKLKCFIHYSGNPPKCECCGEQEMAFLTMDHINGGGRKHKKTIRSRLTTWLRRNNYPKGFRVLCFNCNCGRSINKGICPHQQKNIHK